MAAKKLSLADKVDLLFQKRRRDDGREFPVSALEEKTGISGATFWKVRHGHNKNPGYAVLQAICSFFAVPMAYFDHETLEECGAFLDHRQVAKAPEPVSQIALRAMDLSPEGLEAVRQMIEYVRASEGLPSARQSRKRK